MPGFMPIVGMAYAHAHHYHDYACRPPCIYHHVMINALYSPHYLGDVITAAAITPAFSFSIYAYKFT